MDFEIQIIRFLQAGRTPFFDGFFQIVSNLGTYLGAAALIVLLLIFNRRLCFWYLFSYGFVYLVNNVLVKNLVQRPRPFDVSSTVLNLGDAVTDFSFPSGHIACATAIAIFLGYFLFQIYKKRNERIWIVLGCSAYLVLVAVSRMYLGKHYLTDLIGGFAISAIICLLGIWFMRTYYKHKKEEKIDENKS